MKEPTLADVADKTVDKLSIAAEKLAAHFEALAPGAWETMVRQQQIEAVTTIALQIIFATLAIAGIIIARRMARKTGYLKDDPQPAFLVALGAAVIAFVVAITLAASTTDNVGKLLNPEYYAGMALLEAIK